MKCLVAVFVLAFVAAICAEPNRHPYIQCKIDLYDCMNVPEKKTLECLNEYLTCMKQLIPTLPPMPPLPNSAKCVKDLYGCFTKNEVGNFACVKTFGGCINRELPTFIQTCKSDVKQCWNSASGYMDKIKCCTSFAYCFLNGSTPAPGARVFDTFEDAVDTNDIDGTKIKCKETAKQCYTNAVGLGEKLMCGKELVICLSSGALTQSPPKPSSA